MRRIKKFFDEKVPVETVFTVLRLGLAILISMGLAFVLICTISDTPMRDFMILLLGPFSNKTRVVSIINKFIPLLFTGTAVCFLNATGQISTSAEGAFYFGAVAATAVAIQPGIPAVIHIPLCLLVGGIVGGFVAVIPTFLNVRYGVITIVASLLVNSVFLYLGQYLILNPLRDPLSGFEASYKFSPSAMLPRLFGNRRIHRGLLIGLAVFILGYIVMYKTPFGLKIRTVGRNKRFAKFSGIKIGLVACESSFIAGILAGMGGVTEVLGNYERFVFTGITVHGWYGIVIAVLCKNNPKFVPLAALFIAYLSVAADALNFSTSIPPEIINIIQPVIIMFVAAPMILAGLERKTIVKRSRRKLRAEGGVAENA